MERIPPSRPSVTPSDVAWKTEKAAARLTAPSPVTTRPPDMAPSAFEVSSAAKSSPAPVSTLNFDVHPRLPEVVDFATRQGWVARGWTHLSVFSQELVYSTDDWKTTHALHSSSVPSPFVNGRIMLPNVPAGTKVTFALHLGVACSAPSDIAGHRERGQLWLNNGGWNYVQETH